MSKDFLVATAKGESDSNGSLFRAIKKRGRRLYTNPLQLQTPLGLAQQCPDPALIRSQTPGDPYWYLYCTGGPLNEDDRDAGADLIYHFIPIYRSLDLVHWQYQGDALIYPPTYSAIGVELWAPEIQYFNGRYYLYYVVTKTTYPGSAIGVATSDHPSGPWLDSGKPAIEPHCGQGTGDMPRWCYDPAVVTSCDGQQYIFYGSYFGGISARLLSSDGLSSDPSSQVQITTPNRYEAANVIKRDGYYYLLASVTNACNGPLTGYAVFCGRSNNLLGPYHDREGNALLSSRVGGTPVLAQNGNRWVGPGHEYVIEDFGGQSWMFYHAIDINDPFFTNTAGIIENTIDSQKRPVLMDRLDWVDGWPVIRDGPSDQPQRVPAAQPCESRIRSPRISTPSLQDESVLPNHTVWFDDFDGGDLIPVWTWIRAPEDSSFHLINGCLSFQTQDADLYGSANQASVLTRELPRGDCIIETRMHLNVPHDGVCHNFVQGGLLVYGDQNNFIKLTVTSIWETRQTEFAKASRPLRHAYPEYGNSVIGTPGDWTYLRIVRRLRDGREYYTGHSREAGKNWVRGATWTHTLGSNTHVGLVSMGGSGFESRFDYVWVLGS
jgi:arabinan endo-1,5-alpha-L-arabinosidase